VKGHLQGLVLIEIIESTSWSAAFIFYGIVSSQQKQNQSACMQLQGGGWAFKCDWLNPVKCKANPKTAMVNLFMWCAWWDRFIACSKWPFRTLPLWRGSKAQPLQKKECSFCLREKSQSTQKHTIGALPILLPHAVKLNRKPPRLKLLQERTDNEELIWHKAWLIDDS
jgi:hypothetical protein